MNLLIDIINTDDEPNIINQIIDTTMTMKSNDMINEIITPEKVQELYLKYENKQHFLIVFGTKKFHLIDTAFLNRMYDFLIKKVK